MMRALGTGLSPQACRQARIKRLSRRRHRPRRVHRANSVYSVPNGMSHSWPMARHCMPQKTTHQIARIALRSAAPVNLRALRRHLAELASDPEVNVIVVTGKGDRAFCVGADLTATPGGDTGVDEAFAWDADRPGEHGPYIRLFDFSGLQIRKPVMAAVNGFCLGG